MTTQGWCGGQCQTQDRDQIGIKRDRTRVWQLMGDLKAISGVETSGWLCRGSECGLAHISWRSETVELEPWEQSRGWAEAEGGDPGPGAALGLQRKEMPITGASVGPVDEPRRSSSAVRDKGKQDMATSLKTKEKKLVSILCRGGR